MSSTMVHAATPLDGALWLIRHGFAVFPVDHPTLDRCAGIGRDHNPDDCDKDGKRGKHPAVTFSRTHTRDENEARRLFTQQLRNVGIFVGGCTGPNGEQLLVVDSDRHGALEDAAAKLGEQHIPTMRVHTAQGYHDYYWAPADAKLGNRLGLLDGIFDGDVRAGNAFVVGPGSLHKTGVIYTLDDAEQPPVAAPAWLVTALTTRPQPAPAATGPAPAIALPTEQLDAYTRRAVQAECDAIARAVDGEQNNRLNTAAFNLGTLVAVGALTEADAHQALLAAARAGNHPDSRAIPTINSGLAAGMQYPRTPWPPQPRDRNTFTPRVPHQPGPAPASDTATLHVDEPAAPSDQAALYSRTDDGNALRLVDRHATEVRFCPQRGWLVWDGHRWTWDDRGQVYEMARDIARSLPEGESGEHQHKSRSLSARGLDAMVKVARTDPRIVAPLAALDANPWQLNTPAGVVDLRTGDLSPAAPEALHTRSTTFAPDFEAPAPRFTQFLGQTFGGDIDLITYVQCLFGLSLIGEVREQILPFAFGEGANGKSTIADTVMRIVGIGETGYSISAPSEMLLASSSNSHPTEIARLAGARLVVASELDDGQRFAEARIKMLTGRDIITGRFMRQDFFSFAPTHTLWLLGNHRPAVRTGGPAFWRRLRLVPFLNTVPEHLRDAGLEEYLVDHEGPAILAWLIRGAAHYHQHGLATPAAVQAATDEYKGEQDTVGRFVSDMCTLGAPGTPGMQIPSSALRAAYEAYCLQESEEPVTPKKFAMQLQRAPYNVQSRRTSRARFFDGIRLNNEAR